jgi:hypothetical protein
LLPLPEVGKVDGKTLKVLALVPPQSPKPVVRLDEMAITASPKSRKTEAPRPIAPKAPAVEVPKVEKLPVPPKGGASPR